GAADFTHRILTSGIDMSVEVQGIVSGVRSAPDIFFEEPGVDKHTATVAPQSRQADLLLQYFSEFEEHVRNDGVAVTMLLEAEPVKNALNLTRNVDLTFENEAEELDRARQLDDLIDDRLSLVDYMDETARRWNPSVTQPQIDALRSNLRAEAQQLASAARAIGEVRRATLGIAERDVTPLPSNWHVRKLKPVVGLPNSMPA